MAEGPRGNKRLTSIGPFTYEPDSSPELPRGFEPPDDITNARGDFRWWTNWSKSGDKGATILYDPREDRVIIENRLSGPEGNNYTHDDMVTDLVQRSPLPRIPDQLVPAEGGAVSIGGTVESTLQLPTMAGGAWVVTQRLDDDKEFIEEGEEIKVEWFYKIVHTVKKIDFPESTLVNLKHKLGPRANTVFEAERRFQLEEAYRELQFEGLLPEVKV